jgi:MFS family permease
MLMFALGQILGPTLAGAIADHAGTSTAFALAAGTMGFTLVVVPPRGLRSGTAQRGLPASALHVPRTTP